MLEVLNLPIVENTWMIDVWFFDHYRSEILGQVRLYYKCELSIMYNKYNIKV